MSKTHYFGGIFVIKNLNHGNIFLQSSFINVCAVNQGDNLDITRSCTKVQAGKDITAKHFVSLVLLLGLDDRDSRI